MFVQQLQPPTPEQVDDGIEILHLGPRSSQWYSGGTGAATEPTKQAVMERPGADPDADTTDLADVCSAG